MLGHLFIGFLFSVVHRVTPSFFLFIRINLECVGRNWCVTLLIIFGSGRKRDSS